MSFPFHNKDKGGAHTDAATEEISETSGIYFKISEHHFEVRFLWSNSEAVSEEFDECLRGDFKDSWRNSPLSPTEFLSTTGHVGENRLFDRLFEAAQALVQNPQDLMDKEKGKYCLFYFSL